MRGLRMGPGSAALLLGTRLLAASPGFADESCTPLTRPSLERLARNHALEPDQVAWLLDAWSAGRLAAPPDLEGWPGVGVELRDEIAAAICWESGSTGHLVAGTVARPGFEDRRASVVWDAGVATLRLRGRSLDADPIFRGGAEVRRGPVAAAAGALEGRRGLGLVIETAGAESRGAALRSLASRRFEATLSSDDWTPVGGALGLGRGAWSLDLAGVRYIGRKDPPPIAGLVLERRGRRGRTTLVAAAGASGRAAVSLAAGGGGVGGDWALEAARGGGGSAAALAGSRRLGAWRLRVSLAWWGRSFASPLARGYESPLDEFRVDLVAQAMWSNGRGRTLRLFRSAEHRPDARGFPEGSLRTEVELGERLARGVTASVLWRGKRLVSVDAESASPSAQEIRGELRFTRGDRAVRFRIDERVDGAGSRALHVFLGQRLGAWRAELRVVRSRSGPGAAAPRVYFRRAGDAVGWTTAREGTCFGVWIGGTWKGWTGEMSADGGAGVWTSSWGIQRRFGAP